ncbi:hypothetical protein AB1Y20_004356 [Prymnesium parvum]|uniref:PH domain-containing protein n=1 Tax=Prymnesium parvum TaxID=97485 RepID=A0AB34IXU9_PRYPA
MAMASPEEELSALLRKGHWFLKHRANGDVPHRRFVYTDDDGTIYWATREDRSGKIGSMRVHGAVVVPGCATAVTSSKKRLHERSNRLFSVVGADRSLDLETATEAERHLWVRAFSQFARRYSVAQVDSAWDNGRGSSVSAGSWRTESAEVPSTALAQMHLSSLARHNTEELMAGVRLPRLSGSLKVQLGDFAKSWQEWRLELCDGELQAAEHPGVVDLRHVSKSTVKTVAGATEQGELHLQLKPARAAIGDAPLPELVLRGPVAQVHAWHHAIETTIGLLDDVSHSYSRQGSYDELLTLPAQMQALREDAVELELNRLFEGTFEHCAADAREAIESLEPLLSSCTSKLRSAARSLPPRPDLFRCLAEGMHRRFLAIYSVILVRHDLDVAYLENDAQAAPPVHSKEVLEPSLMLELIGWERRYERAMASAGAGHSRSLISEEAQEALIAAYQHATRQLMKQWATNILFCEQQAMHSAESNSLPDHGRDALSPGIVMLPYGGRQLYFTEMHIDLFRIVNEHVELGLNTGLEVLLFNLLISVGDFLSDVQNMLLLRLRTQWRKLGFVYLCALVNNCSKCIDLWDSVLTSCTAAEDGQRKPLSDPLRQSLHLNYVNDGFVNLSRSAMQLASHQVLMQFEIPLGSLFSGKPHQPNEMGALVSHFLEIVRNGVVSAHAVRMSAIVLEQLYIAYGVMLFVGQAQFTSNTVSVLQKDLDVFAALLEKHCAAGPFASRHKAQSRLRAEWMLSLLRMLQELLDPLLRAPSESMFATDAEEYDGLGSLIVQVCSHAPDISRAVLLRLLSRCRLPGIPGGVLNRRRAAVVDGHERAMASPSTGSSMCSHGTPQRRGNECGAVMRRGSDANLGVSDSLSEPPSFFATVDEALQLGRRFSICRLLELQHSGKREIASK